MVNKIVADGDLSVELKSGDFIEREIHIPDNKRVKISFVSRGADATLIDIIYLGKGSELDYVGRFKISSGKFVNKVKAIHNEPNARSKVEVVGIAKSDALVDTTGDIRADNCETSVNSSAILFDSGRIQGFPRLLISNPTAKANHSFRKIYFSPEQLFYLQSRGVNLKNLEVILERLIMGD